MSGAISTIFQSLSDTPLGSGDGEQHLLRPANAGPPQVLCYAVNHSATTKRRVVKEWISWRSGGNYSVTKGSHKGTGESVQTLREAAARLLDVNEYEETIRPVTAKLVFDNRAYFIPPAASADEEPEPVLIPEGLVDLYCGNYERMNSSDPLERQEEMGKLALRRRHSVVLGEGNPFGYIEFIRKPIVSANLADADRVYADDVVEV